MKVVALRPGSTEPSDGGSDEFADLLELARLALSSGRPTAQLVRFVRDAVPGAALKIGRRAREARTDVFLPVADHDGDVLGVLTGPESTRPALLRLAPVVTAKLSAARQLTMLHGQAARLTELNAAAHAVSADLDLDRVLAAVCGRARTITGAELAYIMLTDDVRGDCYVRASDGVHTQAFREARLQLGAGLGGLVAKENQPYFASDYLHDPRFDHVIDGVVAAEGLVSVMAVPLRTGRDVIGVLFAAYRRPTAFTESDVRILEALAEHAAIGVANARLHQQTIAALTRESELRAVADERRVRLEQLTRLHERLSEIMLTELTTEGLLAAVSAALGHKVVVLDAVPMTNPPAVPIAAGRHRFGWLASADGEPDAGDVQALEQAARVVAAHLLRQRAIAQEQFRVKSELLDRLLGADETTQGETLRAAGQLGLDLAGPLVCLFLRPAPGEQEDLLDVASAAADRISSRSLVVGRAGGVIIVASVARKSGLVAAVIAAAADIAVHVGISDEVSDLAGLSAAVETSQRVAEAACAAGLPAGTAATEDELGVYPALVADSELGRHATRILQPLAEHGPELLQTLEIYLRSGMNSTQTARELNLHVNTLYYRLRRIRELAGYDLDDPETRFELDLAVRVTRAQRRT